MRCFGIILVALVLSQFKILMGQDSIAFSLHFTSHTEEIHISDQEAILVRIEYTYENPVSATPSGSSTFRDSIEISSNSLELLRDRLRRSEFWELDPEFGAPEDQRYYPYTLSVNDEGRQKSVIFRSNPSYENAPEEFWEVVEWAREATKKKHESNSGND